MISQRSESHSPLWNGFGDNVLDNSVQCFIFAGMEVVDVACDSDSILRCAVRRSACDHLLCLSIFGRDINLARKPLEILTIWCRRVVSQVVSHGVACSSRKVSLFLIANRYHNSFSTILDTIFESDQPVLKNSTAAVD
jgi:hypothetical protein